MIVAGKLDQRITIELPATTFNGIEDVSAWVVSGIFWARAMETPGREFLKGDYQAMEKVAFQIRYQAIDSTARVTWSDRVYRIESVTGTYREGETWLHCVSTTGAN